MNTASGYKAGVDILALNMPITSPFTPGWRHTSQVETLLSARPPWASILLASGADWLHGLETVTRISINGHNLGWTIPLNWYDVRRCLSLQKETSSFPCACRPGRNVWSTVWKQKSSDFRICENRVLVVWLLDYRLICVVVFFLIINTFFKTKSTTLSTPCPGMKHASAGCDLTHIFTPGIRNTVREGKGVVKGWQS